MVSSCSLSTCECENRSRLILSLGVSEEHSLFKMKLDLNNLVNPDLVCACECVVPLLFTRAHIHAHGNVAHPETQSNRRDPAALCSHVERPEQLGASVSQRLDLLPEREERQGREGRGRGALWEIREEGLRKVIAMEVSEGREAC